MPQPDTQLQLDIEGSHAATAEQAFRDWLLSLPPTPWTEDDTDA